MIKKNFLYFKITNPIPQKTDYKNLDYKLPEFETDQVQSSGIGLENVKKRLALGYNKDDYKLNIKNKNNTFIVKLKIKVQ